MKRVLSFLLIICLVIGVFSGCGNRGTELTLDNYEQYLDVSAECLNGAVSCNISPVTTNYDFNDVELTIKAKGEYKIYNFIFIGYTPEGWPRYDSTILHSTGDYEETFSLKLNIGGSIINTDDRRVNLEMPSGTTIHGGTCKYEVLSITGTVTRIK